jgi:putative addiction module component (TIGR02574 family)
MPTIDFSHLSPQERLDLIGELWDSLTPDTAPVTAAQKAEIKRRLATLDKDIAKGRDAAEVLADLRRQHG